jgi:hypothetical protein
MYSSTTPVVLNAQHLYHQSVIGYEKILNPPGHTPANLCTFYYDRLTPTLTRNTPRVQQILCVFSTQGQQLIKRISKRGNTIRLKLLSDNIQANAKLLQAA